MGKPEDSSTQMDWTALAEQLEKAGFTLSEREGNAILLSKHGCGAVLERTALGQPRFVVRPGLLVGNRIAHLVDGGFQKFWQDDHRRFPALAEQLASLHRFDQDLRAVMGLTTLYNEALGTVSARYIYDRLEGREEPKRHKPF